MKSREAIIKIDLCIDKPSILKYNINEERVYQQTVCSQELVIEITASSWKLQGGYFRFLKFK